MIGPVCTRNLIAERDWRTSLLARSALWGPVQGVGPIAAAHDLVRMRWLMDSTTLHAWRQKAMHVCIVVALAGEASLSSSGRMASQSRPERVEESLGAHKFQRNSVASPKTIERACAEQGNLVLQKQCQLACSSQSKTEADHAATGGRGGAGRVVLQWAAWSGACFVGQVIRRH